MADKSNSDANQAQDEGYHVDEPDAVAPPASVPAGDKTTSVSASPPPLVPTATKPSALAGQSTINSSVISSQSPALGTRQAPDPVTFQNRPRDPRVASLIAIFPDYDETILHSVLESVDGDQDRAVDLLLGMSDPDFRSEAPPPVQQPQMTQEELDEQFARRLMLEEQQQVQQWQQQHRPHRRGSRIQGHPQQRLQQTGSPPVGGKDTMTEIQEQFSKYAEIGKRNFGSLVSKVKAKIQEFDKPDTGGSASGVQSTWDGAGGHSYYDPNATRQSPPPRTNYQPYQGHHAAGGVQSPPSVITTSTAISQPIAFYDPNPGPQPVSPPTQFTSPALPEKSEKKLTQSSISVEGYEVEPMPSNAFAANSASVTPQAPVTSSVSVPPRGPSPANPIDGGKLGLLPKRPISLIRDPPQTQSPAQRGNAEDNALEYAENPFDDDRK